MGAVAQLHGAVAEEIRDQQTKRQKKGQSDGSAIDGAVKQLLWARQVAGEGALMKKWRVIIRNLPFQVRFCSFNSRRVLIGGSAKVSLRCGAPAGQR